MKKIYALMAILLFTAANVLAQYTTDWIRPADNIAKTGSMIARDNSDNLIVSGYIQSQDIYTRKYNKFGVFQWEKISTSGTASNYEKPVWISIDKDNNIFVVGYRYAISSGRDYPSAIVVLKYNPGGSLLWKKNIPVSVIVAKFGSGLNLRSEVDNIGNLYIGTAAASPSGFVLYKLNASGILVFTKNSNVNAPNSFSSMRLKGNKIVITGGSGTRTAAPVIAFDTTGKVLWTKSVRGQGGNDVELDETGNCYLLTSYSNQVSATSGQDVIIYKFNSTGIQQWKNNYHFGGNDFPSKFTFAGNKLSVIGYSSINAGYFDWITLQVNNAGTMLWNSRYNATTANDELPAFITAKDNGEVYVTGKGGPLVSSVTGSSYLRMITLKYSNTGTVKWVDSLNINGGFGLACVLAKDSSLFVLSHSNMTVYHFIDQVAVGTCTIPTGLLVTNVSTNSTQITWSPVTGANLYHLRYKINSATTWTVISTNLSSYLLAGLSAGTAYNYAVEAVCGSGPSGYCATQTFSTNGIGYCSTGGQSQAKEYLSLVWIGGIMNSTTANNGYADFTNLSTTLTRGQVVSGYLSGMVPYPEYENYCIWIDYNHDNDFTDPGEQVLNKLSDLTGWVAINFTVPSTGILSGPTRMRITMSSGASPSPCGVYARGETEDYSVDIAAAVAQRSTPSIINTENNILSIYPNPIIDILYLKGLAKNKPDQYVEIYDVTGRKIMVSNVPGNSLNLGSLKAGTYLIRVIQNKMAIYSGRVIKK